jgi:hypothetical protein
MLGVRDSLAKIINLVIASEANQSHEDECRFLGCFVAALLAMTYIYVANFWFRTLGAAAAVCCRALRNGLARIAELRWPLFGDKVARKAPDCQKK